MFTAAPSLAGTANQRRPPAPLAWNRHGGHNLTGQSRASLWVPADCRRVRAVVRVQHDLEEITIQERPKFRAALAELGPDDVLCAPPFDHLFRFNVDAAFYRG